MLGRIINRIVLIIAVALLIKTNNATAQRYDANWVFGYNAGIHFDSLNNPVIFKSSCFNFEMNASVMGQNILTMIYDTTFNELILEKDEEMLMRKAQFEDEQAIAETNEPEHDYRLKPNLFDGKLYANITLLEEETGKLEIYNLQGVLVGNLQLVNGKNELDLTPINLPNGVYLYRVWANDEIKHSDKLVKLK